MLILNFKSELDFKISKKNNYHFGLFSTPFSLEINFLLANFLIECSRTTLRYTDLKEKLKIVSLLEFYINYLAWKKHKQILIHNITFCMYVGMYLHIREAIFNYNIFEKYN